MRRVILLMHVSLDGFVAGPNGEMDWIKFDDEMINDTDALTASSDTALFGRVTYQMMAGYWPTAAEQPGATKHDIDHARWVNSVPKLVFSKTLKNVEWENSSIISSNIAEEITNLKQQPGKNLLMIGSTRTAQAFMELGLIDDYRINVNPVVLGSGSPLFKDIKDKINLNLVEAKMYQSGVVGLHYETKRD
jgi:dihydrofolate reductase